MCYLKEIISSVISSLKHSQIFVITTVQLTAQPASLRKMTDLEHIQGLFLILSTPKSKKEQNFLKN